MSHRQLTLFDVYDDTFRLDSGIRPMTEEDVDDGYLKTQIAAEIRVRRKIARQTTSELAERVGVSEAVIHGVECDYMAMPSIRLLQWISAALGCRVEIRFVKRGAEMPM